MPDETPKRIRDSTFAIVANGAPDSPPASGLRDYLLEHGARRLVTVFHPLNRGDPPVHEIAVFERGRPARRRRLRLPSRPPLTYPLDLVTPPWLPPVDGWFASNNLQALRGLVARRVGRARRVVYWPPDFVPDRFGGGVVERVYHHVDGLVCRRADVRVDLTREALDGRNARHGMTDADGALALIVPVGAWLDRVPRVPDDGWRARKVVFAGHLVERQGVDRLIDAVGVLKRRGVAVTAEIAGRGPEEERLRRAVADQGLNDTVRFVGFLEDHTEVEAFLASGSVGLAPYSTVGDSFSRFADPSKLKAYLGAGLPIVLTDVPPNAGELQQHAGAEVVGFDAEAIADGIERAIASPEGWAKRRAAAIAHARNFDWGTILGRALPPMGFAP